MKAGESKRDWLALVAPLATRPRLFADDNDAISGMIGGCFGQAFTQMIGAVASAAWARVIGFVVFQVIKSVIGLHATDEEPVLGLDITEHGYSAYEPTMVPTPAGD